MPCSWLAACVLALIAERRAARRTLIISTVPSPLLGTPEASPAKTARAAASAPVLWALHLKHLDSHGPQVAGEPGPVAACAFYPGAPHGAKTLSPTEKPLVTLHVRWHARLAQVPAQMVYGHGHVEVQVRVHAQDRLDLSVRPLGADHRHVKSSLRCRQQLLPDEQEGSDDTVMSHAEASSYEVTTLRLRVAVGRYRGASRRVTCKAPLGPTWKEGQAAPRRRPQPSSRILTAWKEYSQKFTSP